MEKTVALVTGGAKRVGRAIALDLARHSFNLAIHHRPGTDVAPFAAELEAAGARAVLLPADLNATEDCGTLIRRATEALGPVRLLVNNASIFEDDTAADFDWSNWDQHFALHLKAPVELTRRFAEALPQGAEGLVVNIIDQRVWRLTPRFFSYTLSKSALWTATQTMAQSFAPRIRVNAIGPGPTLKNARQSEEDFSAQIDALLLGRGPELSEFGATIRYLWEARSITGQMIALDGGQHLAWATPDIAGIRE